MYTRIETTSIIIRDTRGGSTTPGAPFDFANQPGIPGSKKAPPMVETN